MKYPEDEQIAAIARLATTQPVASAILEGRCLIEWAPQCDGIPLPQLLQTLHERGEPATLDQVASALISITSVHSWFDYNDMAIYNAHAFDVLVRENQRGTWHVVMLDVWAPPGQDCRLMCLPPRFRSQKEAISDGDCHAELIRFSASVYLMILWASVNLVEGERRCLAFELADGKMAQAEIHGVHASNTLDGCNAAFLGWWAQMMMWSADDEGRVDPDDDTALLQWEMRDCMQWLWDPSCELASEIQEANLVWHELREPANFQPTHAEIPAPSSSDPVFGGLRLTPIQKAPWSTTESLEGTLDVPSIPTEDLVAGDLHFYSSLSESFSGTAQQLCDQICEVVASTTSGWGPFPGLDYLCCLGPRPGHLKPGSIMFVVSLITDQARFASAARSVALGLGLSSLPIKAFLTTVQPTKQWLAEPASPKGWNGLARSGGRACTF